VLSACPTPHYPLPSLNRRSLEFPPHRHHQKQMAAPTEGRACHAGTSLSRRAWTTTFCGIGTQTASLVSQPARGVRILSQGTCELHKLSKLLPKFTLMLPPLFCSPHPTTQVVLRRSCVPMTGGCSRARPVIHWSPSSPV
jgi:hypothetical protein